MVGSDAQVLRPLSYLRSFGQIGRFQLKVLESHYNEKLNKCFVVIDESYSSL